MKSHEVIDELLPLKEWYERFPNEYILCEDLEYSDSAQITKARLIAHGADKAELAAIEQAYRDAHPDSCLGIDWTGESPEGWILML